jgi:hypothetical protein
MPIQRGRPDHPNPPTEWHYDYRQPSIRFPQARPVQSVASRSVPALGTRITVYLSRAHLAIEGEGSYVVFCERHGTFVTAQDRADALETYKYGSTTDWCDRCRANEYMLKRMRAVKR